MGVGGSGFTYGPFQKSSLQAPGPAAHLTPEAAILIQSCLAQGAGGRHHTTQLYSAAESCSGRKSPSLTGEQLVTSRCVQFLLSPGRGTFLCPLPRGFGNFRNWVPRTRRPFSGKSRLNGASLLSVPFPRAGVGKLPCAKLSPLRLWGLWRLLSNDLNLPLIRDTETYGGN